MLTLRAYAKVNLTLEVLGKRPDGYHDIVSVVQTVGLYDTITLEKAPSLTLEGSPEGVSMEADLVYQAARLLQGEAGVSQGARIQLEKRIPIAAGLGGGSSDAAATLRGLDLLWGLGLGPAGLHPLAARLGSDVPFFLKGGGTALLEGKGERVTPLPMPKGDLGVVLLHPPITIPNKTASLYQALPPGAYTRGDATRFMVQRLETGEPLRPEELSNSFDWVAWEAFPGLEEHWRAFQARTGHPQVHLVGSGPTLFALTDWEYGETILRELVSLKHEAYLAKLVVPAASPSLHE